MALKSTYRINRKPCDNANNGTSQINKGVVPRKKKQGLKSLYTKEKMKNIKNKTVNGIISSIKLARSIIILVIAVKIAGFITYWILHDMYVTEIRSQREEYFNRKAEHPWETPPVTASHLL